MSLTPSAIKDLPLAATKMNLVERRAFFADMCLKYCQGSPRKAERVFGWRRTSIELGLKEKHSGIICLGAQSVYSGRKKWSEKEPLAAQSLREIAERYAQQNPTFNNPITYTRLTIAEAIKQLKEIGYKKSQLPSPSTMAVVLNRMGDHLRKVLKAKPKKKFQKRMLSSRI